VIGAFRGGVVLLLAAAMAVGAAVPAQAGHNGRANQHLGDRTLKPGDRGQDVRILQDFLTRAGHRTRMDGHFGPATSRSVRAFKRAVTRPGGARITRADVTALREAARSARTSSRAARRPALGSRSPLRRGHSGQDIRVLQDYLTRAGHRVRVDGRYGAATGRAIRAFQREHGRSANSNMPADDIALLRHVVETRASAASNPTSRATIRNGLAIPPDDAPEEVKKIIEAGNRIAKMPYKYGGGHGRWDDDGYDCSGSVSFALYGAGLIERSMPSGPYASWGEPGAGRWVTTYANAGHMYMVVAGVRFDTSGRANRGTRWTTQQRSSNGFTARHPRGL
jgi:peptidoglycan hydrolase-like protein with peptidoglycan-binding domain